jgi:hypothetical protein
MENTESTTESLSYDPDAKIVINRGDFYNQNWAEVTAYEATAVFRSEKSLSMSNSDKTNKINRVKEYLIENYQELDEHANDIAELLGIELTKTVQVALTVELDLTIRVPVGEDIDDIMQGIEVEVTTGWDTEAELEASDVRSTDWTEE